MHPVGSFGLVTLWCFLNFTKVTWGVSLLPTGNLLPNFWPTFSLPDCQLPEGCLDPLPIPVGYVTWNGVKTSEKKRWDPEMSNGKVAAGPDLWTSSLRCAFWVHVLDLPKCIKIFRWRQQMVGAATRATVALCMCNASWVMPPVNSCSQSWQVSMDFGASHWFIVLEFLLGNKILFSYLFITIISFLDGFSKHNSNLGIPMCFPAGCSLIRPCKMPPVDMCIYDLSAACYGRHVNDDVNDNIWINMSMAGIFAWAPLKPRAIAPIVPKFRLSSDTESKDSERFTKIWWHSELYDDSRTTAYNCLQRGLMFFFVFDYLFVSFLQRFSPIRRKGLWRHICARRHQLHGSLSFAIQWNSHFCLLSRGVCLSKMNSVHSDTGRTMN